MKNWLPVIVVSFLLSMVVSAQTNKTNASLAFRIGKPVERKLKTGETHNF